MITFLQGHYTNLDLYASKKYTNENDVVIYGTRDFAIPFLIFRGIIPFLRKRIGNAPIDELLFSYKTSVSVIYTQLETFLDEKEKKLQVLNTGRLDSNITHSTVAKSAITTACAEILVQLYELYPFRLIIPDVTYLEINSIDLLKFMYQVYPQKSPDLVLGYDPDWENDTHDKESGISWYYSLDTATILQSFVYSFERISSSTERINNEPAASGATQPAFFDMNLFLDKYDDGIEWEVYNIVHHMLSSSMDRDKAVYVLKAIKKCFQLCDFTNAMLLGIKAQKALEPFITKEEKAVLLHIIGLCVHNRHFFSQDNLPLANYLHQTFKEAFEYETDPSRRIALLYRLTVTLSRRKNEISAAREYVEQAYKELNEFEGPNKKLLFAWIKNVHSYILMKEKELKASIEKHEEAFYLLDETDFDPLYVSTDEVNYTKAVLAENLSTLNAVCMDYEKMEYWYRIESFYTDKWPSLNAVSYAEWQSYYYQQLKITEACHKAAEGLKKSQESFNYILEYFFTLSLADLHNRLGNADEAISFYKTCFIFHKNIGHSYSQATLFALQMAVVKLLIRLKNYGEALSELKNIDPEESGYDSLVLLEQLSVCYAHLGKADEAETCMNSAIDMAVKDGGCDLLFKVTLAAGKTGQLLKRKNEATEAYLQAMDLSKTVHEEISFTPQKSDLSVLYLGLLECGEPDTELVTELIKNTSEALKKNTEYWWELKRVLHLISVLPVKKKNALIEITGPFYKNILKAASQRKDCQQFLHQHTTELHN